MTINKAVQANLRNTDEPNEWSELKSIGLIRMVGYCLLLLALIDFFYTLLPPQFMEPQWELTTIKTIVERVPVPLIGLALVFYRGETARQHREVIVLKVLSWFCMIAAVVFFLLVPLTVSNTLRLDNLNAVELENQLLQQKAQVDAVRDKLEQTSDSNIVQLIEQLEAQGQNEDIETPDQFRAQVSSELATAEQAGQSLADQTLTAQRLGLAKNAAKWVLGAFIAGLLFVRMWQITGWVRDLV
ncbi:hypothetical protein Pse7367_1138 [Thalassoporum mexicanum PCC 7367]|uniref:HpsJ-like protein, cyanoexosortase A-associated n=1 Tax=Thalassoporum mexicanum TaxID=3457544 RepID=UPI00029F8993|nr:HpsJ family protein [Pseudanabaena sp. PCC 7367]AFY69435.1 hypothetical protein Pse7367_1138 [Pseudanabaena sp. PCC 7367]